MKAKRERFRVGEYVRLGETLSALSRVVYPYCGDALDTAKPIQASRFWKFRIERIHEQGKALCVARLTDVTKPRDVAGWFDLDALEPAMNKEAQ